MKSIELQRAVACATGETIARIARMGFSYIEVPVPRPEKRARRRRHSRREQQRPAATLAVG